MWGSCFQVVSFLETWELGAAFLVIRLISCDSSLEAAFSRFVANLLGFDASVEAAFARFVAGSAGVCVG